MPWGEAQSIGVGLLGGLLLALILLIQFDRFRGPLIWSGIGVTGLAVIGLAGAISREISFTQAIVTVAFAGAALVAAAHAIQMLVKGDAIGLQSHWGGLGGALGGWRLSPVTSLLVLALV